MTKQDLKDLYGLLTELKNERVDHYADYGYDAVIMDPEELYELDSVDHLIACADVLLGIIEDEISRLEKIEKKGE